MMGRNTKFIFYWLIYSTMLLSVLFIIPVIDNIRSLIMTGKGIVVDEYILLITSLIQVGFAIPFAIWETNKKKRDGNNKYGLHCPFCGSMFLIEVDEPYCHWKCKHCYKGFIVESVNSK